MKITYEERRAKAVKEKYCFRGKVCKCCKAKVKREKMWAVRIEEHSYKTTVISTLFFCKDCAPTHQDVLNKIEGKSIFGVD